MSARVRVTGTAAAACALLLALIVGQVSPASAAGTWSAGIPVSGPGSNTPKVAASADGTKLSAVWTNGSTAQASTSFDSGLTWSAPVDVSAPGAAVLNPQIVASNDGLKLTVVWQLHNGTNYVVQANSSTNGGTNWLGARNVSTGGGSAIAPQLAGSADGSHVQLIWQRGSSDPTTPPFAIEVASTADAGANWTPPIEVSAAGSGTVGAEQPQITSSADGLKLAAVWKRWDTANYRIQIRTSTDGGGAWAPPIDLTDNVQPTNNPQVVSSTDGQTLTAVWTRFNGSTAFVVQARTSTDSGANWTAVADLSSGASADIPDIAGSADGSTAAVVWKSANIIQGSVTTNSGSTWSATPDLSGSGANYPQIVASSDGTHLAAIWNGSVVESARSTNSGSAWSSAVAVSSASGLRPAIASSVGGAKLVTAFPQSNVVTASVLAAPGPLTFSTGAFGATTVDTATPLIVTVKNTGSDDATPTAITSTGAGVTITGGTCATSTPIVADATCTVILNWTPGVAGNLADATLALAYPNGDDAGAEIALTGHATTVVGPLAFSSGNFGSAIVGTSKPLAVAVTNNGTASVTPTAIVEAGSGVDITGGSCAVSTEIAPGHACTVNLSWSPSSPGPLIAASLTFAYLGDNSPDAATLTGIATAAPLALQRPFNSCVLAGAANSIPRRGKKALLKPGCMTTARQRVSVTATPGSRRPFKLYCQLSRTVTTVATMNTGGHYCPQGVLAIRTFGNAMTMQIVWRAPAPSGYAAYSFLQAYKI